MRTFLSGPDRCLLHRVWLSSWTLVKRRERVYAEVEALIGLRVPIGHLEQEHVTAQCAVQFPPSSVRHSASYAPQIGSCMSPPRSRCQAASPADVHARSSCDPLRRYESGGT